MTDIFTAPDSTIKYQCSPDSSSKGFTKLMKWVLLTKSNPDLLINIKYLIESDPDILNKQNDKGWTALMLACISDSTSIQTVELLLSLKPSLNLINKYGGTALSMP